MKWDPPIVTSETTVGIESAVGMLRYLVGTLGDHMGISG